MYLEHVNLTVSDLDDADRLGAHVDDLDEARRRLERLGASVHLEGSYEPGRRISCVDPDGHEVELVAP